MLLSGCEALALPLQRQRIVAPTWCKAYMSVQCRCSTSLAMRLITSSEVVTWWITSKSLKQLAKDLSPAVKAGLHCSVL